VSDQEIGKKEIERDELALFLEAYEHATGERLKLGASGENPDFVCTRADGSWVGIELTKIRRDHHVARLERILARKETMGDYEMLEFIAHQLERKEKARASRYVKRVPETILVLQLVDGSLSDGFQWMLDGLGADFADHGFAEVWLADYSDLDAYGDIELFGLFPASCWGYHERPWPDRKPYG
jgi:hypothetical protein